MDAFFLTIRQSHRSGLSQAKDAAISKVQMALLGQEFVCALKMEKLLGGAQCIRTLVVDHQNPTIIYLGTQGGGVVPYHVLGIRFTCRLFFVVSKQDRSATYLARLNPNIKLSTSFRCLLSYH
jgi:hypothetical protein